MSNPDLEAAREELEVMAALLGMDYEKNLSTYRLNLREAVRSFFRDTIDGDGFYERMIGVIRRGFRQAWGEGLAKYGMSLNDMNPGEQAALANEIDQEIKRVDNLLDYVASVRESGGKITTVLNRTARWTNTYIAIRSKAETMAAKDQPLQWNLHPAEHCSSCLKLSGKIKRASFWAERGIYPKAWDKLDCRNGCQCSLDPTTEPLSKGPLPNLP